MKKLVVIWVAQFILAMTMAQAGETPPLQLVQTIPLPDVEGRIDHFSVDVEGQRIFVAALGNGTVEVLDVSAGKRLASIPGLKEPQGVRYVPDSNKIFVASAGDGTLKSFDGDTYELIHTVTFSSDADNIRYDPDTDQLFVGYGNGAIGILDATTEERLADIPVGGHPESFQLETLGSRIFVNVPTARRIAVIDREQGIVVDTWPVTQATANFPMALDEANQRLFVGCRTPAQLLVYDTTSGQVVAPLPIVGDTDDVFYDADTQRVYVSGGGGAISVFQQQDADQYPWLATIPTADGARTSLFVPEFGRLYLAVPHRGEQLAEIRVYEVQP